MQVQALSDIQKSETYQTLVSFNFTESLILAQSERWRRG